MRTRQAAGQRERRRRVTLQPILEPGKGVGVERRRVLGRRRVLCGDECMKGLGR